MNKISRRRFTALTGVLTAAQLLPVSAQSAAEEAFSVVDRWREEPTQIFNAETAGEEDLTYRVRPLILFADRTDDPLFLEQIALIQAEWEPLIERDVMVISDTNPALRTPLRQRLRPHGFSLVLIDKDDRVILRKPSPWHVRELTRSIDKSPLRQQEIGRLR